MRIDDEQATVAARMRALYDTRAAEYDAATGSLSCFPGLEDDLADFLRLIPRTGRILDLGCGSGRDSRYFSEQGREVVAADISRRMLLIARSRAAGAAAVQLDMTELPFAEGTFVGTWICSSLVHVPGAQHRKVLGEAFRVLRAGGAVSISMRTGDGEGWRAEPILRDLRWFTYVQPEAFQELMELVGFADVTTSPTGRSTWFIAQGVKA